MRGSAPSPSFDPGRRRILGLLGAMLGSAAAALAGAPAKARRGARKGPPCTVRPRQTEGPYFVDEQLLRSDLRTDPGDGSPLPGTPLRLRLHVARVAGGGCAPLAGAQVDLWHCDAQGVYSDVLDTEGRFDTRGRRFLRGQQVTDAAGDVVFTTVYPGWYEGRAVHLHFKVRTEAGQEFTSQLYFDDALTDRVHAAAPYAARGPRDTRNPQDGIFRRGGNRLLLDLAPEGEGYVGAFELGLRG